MRSLLSLLVFVGLSGVAQAQSVAVMLGDSGLTPDDIKAVLAESEALYTNPEVQAGDKSTWQNEASGASGSIEVTGVEEGCVLITHIFETKEKAGQQRAEFKRCKRADGLWQLE